MIKLSDFVMPAWVKFLIGYLLILLAIIGAMWAIYNCGVMDERERNAALENAKIAEYGTRILELQTKVREDERASVKLVNDLTVDYEKRLQNAQIKTQSALRDVASGALKLRIATASRVQACPSASGTASAAASSANESTAELSPAAAEFLITLADQCDTAAEKLNLCIDIAEADRVQAK